MGIKPSLILLTILFSGFTALAQTYPPRDESGKDPQLSAFVSQLKTAVEEKDAAFIKSRLDKLSVSGFDGETGIDLFMQTWEVNNPNSRFWPNMQTILKQGGVFLKGDDVTERHLFVFPYTYTVELDPDADYFNIGIISGEKVNIRKSPDTKAQVVTQLSYALIEYVTDEDDIRETAGMSDFGPEWYHVRTPDNKVQGWVYHKYLSDLVGPRLFLFKDVDGNWMISTFVEGD